MSVKFSAEWLTHSRYSVNDTYSFVPGFELHSINSVLCFAQKLCFKKDMHDSKVRPTEPHLKWA